MGWKVGGEVVVVDLVVLAITRMLSMVWGVWSGIIGGLRFLRVFSRVGYLRMKMKGRV